jgi:serine/threonine-protein kinase
VRWEGNTEVVKVMDFGIAKALEEVHRELTANLFLGKFEYASPEQCGYGLEKGETIDRRTDVYSLGVTLFKMITGTLPFTAATPQGYLVKHATEAAPLPSSVAPDARIPPELDRLVAKTLAKKRTERQQSMADFIQELDGVPVGERTNAPAPTLVVASPSPISGPAQVTSPSQPPPRSGITGALKIGESFARKYVVKGLLGKGGMGVVYRAVDTILDEPVALKVISERLFEGRDAVERLKREVVLARRVSHPNVCRIYDIGQSETGAPYVSMEYIDGKPLGDVLKSKGVLTLREGIPIVRQVLDALAAAHRVNVIHRDLKPDNIMVTSGGQAVIMDFGLSLSEDSRRVTQAGFLIGTPQYMAPEQATGATVDPRTDLYAVGVILFRMFTGKLPFTSSNLVDILRAHVETPPPRPTELNPTITPLLESIILRALEKDPSHRFASADAFLSALDPVEPSQVRSSTESGRVVRVSRTGRHQLGDELPTAIAPAPPRPGTSSRPRRDTERERLRSFIAPSAPGAATAGTSALEPTIGGEPSVHTQLIEETAAQPAPTRLTRARGVRARPGHGSWPAVGGALAAAVVVTAVGWYLLRAPEALPTPSPPPSALPNASPSPPSPSTTLPATSSPVIPASTPRPAPTAPAGSSKPSVPAPRSSPVVTASLAPTPPSIAATAPPPLPTTTLAPAPTPPPAPAASSPATLPTPLPRPGLTPDQGVRQALQEYAEAFSRLDKAAVRKIFPTVPDRNFEGLDNFKAFRMEIAVSKLQVELPRVIVETQTRTTYTSFSGKQESRATREKMVFIESRDGQWVRVQ